MYGFLRRLGCEKEEGPESKRGGQSNNKKTRDMLVDDEMPANNDHPWKEIRDKHQEETYIVMFTIVSFVVSGSYYYVAGDRMCSSS